MGRKRIATDDQIREAAKRVYEGGETMAAVGTSLGYAQSTHGRTGLYLRLVRLGLFRRRIAPCVPAQGGFCASPACRKRIMPGSGPYCAACDRQRLRNGTCSCGTPWRKSRPSRRPTMGPGGKWSRRAFRTHGWCYHCCREKGKEEANGA